MHEHMPGREDRVPPVTLDLDDMRSRYDAYQHVVERNNLTLVAMILRDLITCVA